MHRSFSSRTLARLAISFRSCQSSPRRFGGERARAEVMDFQLSEEQALIRDTAREFAQAEVAPRAAELDQRSEFPYEAVTKMAELGLMGLPIPEEFGGAGADTLSYAVAVEEISRADAS